MAKQNGKANVWWSPNHKSIFLVHYSHHLSISMPSTMRYFWYYICLMMIAKRAMVEEEEVEKRPYRHLHSCYQKRFHHALLHEDCRLHQRWIPRVSPQDASKWSWHRLYYSENDQALIMLTGLDHATFTTFCSCFSQYLTTTHHLGRGIGLRKYHHEDESARCRPWIYWVLFLPGQGHEAAFCRYSYILVCWWPILQLTFTLGAGSLSRY